MKTSPLETIPWIGKSITKKLNDIWIFEITDLIEQDPEKLYDQSNITVWSIQDRCLLYTFRCAVYVVNTPINKQESKLLKRRNRKF